VSTSPEVVKGRKAAIRKGVAAIEVLERSVDGSYLAQLALIRKALEAFDEDQSEIAATLDLALLALKDGDRDGVRLKGGAWVPRDVVIDQIAATLQLRRRRGGGR
jgi:hypothetical protein